MKEFEIWVEGYAVTGNREKASLLGKEIAETWDEAVCAYMNKNPDRIRKDFRGYTNWGCRLFDNETDARKSFG
jgi:hypothetical protein